MGKFFADAYPADQRCIRSGEVSALVSAGSFRLEDALAFVRKIHWQACLTTVEGQEGVDKQYRAAELAGKFYN